MSYLFNHRERLKARRTTMLLVALLLLCTPVCGSESVARPTLDETCDLWHVTTRHMCRCDDEPKVMHYTCKGGWKKASMADFLAADDPLIPTAFMVHGNDNDPETAIEQGMQFWRNMCRTCCADQPKMRFVIWSWPSTYVPGTYSNDLRVKAGRVDRQAYYLARFLVQLQPDMRVSLIGYSYGAPICAGALHLLAGGKLEGRTVVDPHLGSRRHYRMVMIAAAMSDNSLIPGCRYGKTMEIVERAAIFVNPCDRILHFYPRIYRGRGPFALGHNGPVGLNKMGDARKRMVFYNPSNEVGHKHWLKNYLRAGGVMSTTWREAFFFSGDSESMLALAN